MQIYAKKFSFLRKYVDKIRSSFINLYFKNEIFLFVIFIFRTINEAFPVEQVLALQEAKNIVIQSNYIKLTICSRIEAFKIGKEHHLCKTLYVTSGTVRSLPILMLLLDGCALYASSHLTRGLL